MDKEELHPTEKVDKEQEKSPKDVKKLISEGALSVFREENQVKVKPAPDVEAEESKKKAKPRLSHKEFQYYTSSCQKFREENLILMGLSWFIAMGLILLHILLPKTNLHGIPLDIAMFFIGLAELLLLGGIVISILANAFLSRFLVLVTQETVLAGKKNILTFLAKGYACKQAVKILWIGGVGFLVLFLLFYLATFSIILSLCILMVVVGLAIWLYAYTKMLEKTGVLKLPRSPLPVLEEDVSNVYPGEVPEETKSEIDENSILTGILAVLKSGGPKVRRNAVKVLAKIATPEAIQTLMSALQDPAPEVRSQVVAALGRTGEKHVREVIQCLLDDESSEVRVSTAEALGALQDKNALDALIHCLDDMSPEVRGAAAEALGNLRKKKSIKPLLARMKDNDWFVRHKVIIALGKMKADLGVDAIEKLLQARLDEHDYVSSAAKHVLKKVAEDMSQGDAMYDEVTQVLEHEGVTKGETKPEATLSKSDATVQPAIPVQPDSTAQPAIPVQPDSTAQPAIPVQPDSTAQPAIPVQPDATAQPATPQPDSKAQPATPQPDATAQPATPQPDSTAQPASSEVKSPEKNESKEKQTPGENPA